MQEEEVKNTNNNKKVVVVGGGVSGSFLAYNIQHSAEVTLIDQKEYFEIPWASLRAMVDESFATRSVINHSDYLPNVKVIVSLAVDITESHVVLEDGQTVPYDYLVVATGHFESIPRTRDERLAQYQADFNNVKCSDSILIVGGGPTGVELASEIAFDFPEKKLMLVHRGPRLLEYMSPRASQKVYDWLVSKRVQIILDQSIDLKSLQDDGAVVTSGGETINADCRFICAGKPMGSYWLRSTILKDSLDLGGRLMVDYNLRVRGFKHIFAIGDITDVLELKLGYFAQRHAMLTAKNLKLLLTGRSDSKMGSYRAGYPVAVISLGRKEAMVHLPFITLTGSIPGLLKSRDLYVGRTRKQLGLKPYIT